MKIDAYIDIVDANTDSFIDTATIQVDADYVEDNEAAVNEWIENSNEWHEIESNWQRGGKLVQFNVTNMQDVIEELKFDEFQKKAN